MCLLSIYSRYVDNMFQVFAFLCVNSVFDIVRDINK